MTGHATRSCPTERFDTVADARLALNLRRMAAHTSGSPQEHERVAVGCDRCEGAHITRATHRRAVA